MEDHDELHPTRDEKGVHIFDVAEVTRLAQERARRAVDPTKEGERDARAFELLDAGHDLRYLVTTLRISADIGKRIINAWLEAGQSDVVVPRACKIELERCLGRFRDAAELVQRVCAAETANEGVNEQLMQLDSRLNNLVVFIGELAARIPALADVMPAVRERLDGELAQVLDRAFECVTTQLVSAAPRPPIAPGAGEGLSELRNTVASAADREVAAGAVVGHVVELPGSGASSDATSAPDTSTTKASENNESADESVAAERTECESVGELIDEWLKSLRADDARHQQLAVLLKREELEMFAELERGIGIEAAATTGSRSPREQLADALLVSLTENDARLYLIGAMLTASEIDMLIRLARGLAECETASVMDGPMPSTSTG